MKMGIFDVTRYLRALFLLLPMGLGFSYWGFDGLIKNADDLPYTKGVISKVKMGTYYFDDCKCRLPTYFFYLEDIKAPFITQISKNLEIIDSTEINIGDQIEVWVWDLSDNNSIQQLKINGKMIIPYNRTFVLYLSFFVVGLGLLVIFVGYTISSLKDSFGKK